MLNDNTALLLDNNPVNQYPAYDLLKISEEQIVTHNSLAHLWMSALVLLVQQIPDMKNLENLKISDACFF